MLTETENKQLAALLAKVVWPLPLDTFLAFCASNITAGTDLALVRNAADPEVLLTKRSADDPYFAGLWHLPGGIVIPGETALSTLNKRMLKEINISLSGTPQLLIARDIMKGPPGLNSSPRGQEMYRCFHYLLQDTDPDIVTSDTIQFFSLAKLPKLFIEHQLPTIEALRGVYNK